jgi:hypothetical protein
MSNDSQQIVGKAWNFAHVLRDDNLSYLAYTEQITFLLFLKMADEMTRPPFNRSPIVPPRFGWQALLKLDGDELEAHYRHCLEELGKQPGMLGEIFKKARAEIQNPERLRRLIVDLIEPVKWSSMQADVKGDIYDYEDLLKRDKVNLDIFWLRDRNLEESDDLPEPDVLAQEIADDLQTALEQFSAIAEKLKG